MMKKFLFVLLATAMIVHTNAQKGESKDYARMKEEITQKIFGTPDSLFESNTVPEQYKNESTVILAQKQQLESDANFKFKFGFFGSSSGNKFTFYKTFREKVFINDQSSLDDYSQLNFSKLQAKRSGYLGKMKNYSFMNIRLIKPNGTVKNIDVSESTVTLEEGNDKAKNKIAIPDLSIGDIIDYYVVNFYEEEGMVGSGGSTVDYLLEENYPIVNYLLSLQFNRRIAP